jgi:nitric oxide reductase large subunit
MLATTPVRDDDRLTPPIRRYLRWLVVSMSMYASLLVTSLFALRAVPAEALVLRAAFGLLPVLPLLILIWAFARYIREADEMQRQIELQAVALAAMATGIGFMVAGFLANAGVFALKGELVAILVLPALFGSYGVAKAVVMRSYAG